MDPYPYYYTDTEEERTRATNEILANPYHISTAGLETGKELYGYYCAICHGDKGDGNGYIVREDGGVYPAQPTSFLTDELITSSNGRYYHALMFGKNVMGGYKDKLSYEERWQVIHHIRSLQAAEKKVKYNADVNELNSVEIPANKVAHTIHVHQGDEDSEEGHSHDSHSEDHDHHGEGDHDSEHHH